MGEGWEGDVVVKVRVRVGRDVVVKREGWKGLLVLV